MPRLNMKRVDNMITIDTNVIVRYLAKDDLLQAQQATHLLTSQDCMILQTVLLEAVWVLSSKVGLNWVREAVVERIRHILCLPTIWVQEPANVALALSWYESGMDFADALHLANSVGDFATFDRRMSNKAEVLKTPNKVVLLGDEVKQ
jgi:predicted nucleic-acid-binding protein